MRAAESRTEPKWATLIELEKPETADEAAAVVSQPERRRPRWFWPAIAGACSLAMSALCVTIYVASDHDHDRPKIVVSGPEAIVKADHGKTRVTTPQESHAEVPLDQPPVLSGPATRQWPQVEVAPIDPIKNPQRPDDVDSVGSRLVVESPRQDSTAAETGYVSLFNGKNFAGWSAWNNSGPIDEARAAGIWWVRDGVLHGTGGPSLLFSPRGDYANFRVRAEVKINNGGNSGLYFRTAKGPGFKRGYEAQINCTGADPNRNGSLYRPPQPPIEVRSSLVAPDTWFSLEVEAIGERIRVWVNGTRTVDWGDLQKTHTRGHLALQAHDAQTHVQVRKLELMELDSGGSGGWNGSSTRASEIPTWPRAATAATGPTAARSSSPKGVNKSVGDAIQPGTVWKGERAYRWGWWSPGTVTYEVHVTEREGKTFKGHKFDNGKGRNRTELEGRVDGGRISWTERSANFVLTTRGNLVGDMIQIEFTGYRGSAAVVSGDAKLTRQ